MDSSQSPLTRSEFDSYHTQLQASALKATKHAASLPTDLAFHRSVDSDLARDLEACSNKVISITNTLLNLASTLGSSKSAKRKGKARVRDEDDFLDRFESLVVEPMDQLFERADIALDQFSGRSKAPAIAINPPEPKKVTPKGRQEPVIQHASHLQKPQLKFKRKVDNTNSIVWSPTLRHKFNARMPLGFTFDPATIGDHPDEELPPHPYRYEINNISYPAHMFQSQTPIPFKPFEETPFTWVSTRAHLAALIDKLRESREIAIDLEYHSYRTYCGFVCLMQISTRDEDWIVDPFELRDELEDLNEVFTDPSIVKVLHGADSDVVWLQQDFKLYLVNMFDTFHASKVLDFPRHGLAALLEMYCDFSPDKRYQLADWRIRPLPDEMLKYARADTHFLLYVYDNLRNALLDRAVSRGASPTSRAGSPTAPDAFVREVLSRSAETALRVYSPDPYDAEGGTGFNGWDSLARRWNKPTLGVDGAPTVQREVFRAVHVWRDRVAREEDESTGYVLSNRFLFKLVEQPPADMAALLHALPSTPPVRRRATELLDVIRGAVRKGLSEPAAPSEPAPIVSSEATPQQRMDVDVSSEHADPACASTSLWSRSKPLPTSTTSSLFGAATVLPFPSGYSTSQSSLFGVPPTSAVSKTKSIGRFQDVVNRIHSTLVVAPTVPRAPQEVTAATTVETMTSVPEVSIDGATAEIPFVPAALRQTAKPEVVDDAIVVVGQRQKKRKRTKKAGTTGDDDGERSAVVPAEKVKAKTEEVVPFDFASAPNILDEGERSEHEDGRAGKRKRQKKALLERGDFPAAPKDQRELRSGNVSHTFRP
ncbi:ribonuclease H-like domain-containing protein [Lactarius akahatsu]|uniref:Ribonuclease H-like domain-containing protein n=1 Tax=Lactarius akahatsu TaxID=416441 RepID=A0AAD4LQG3_9AGAM|nr:ribonuclease H-like domain-containing protein [Lactarius akahatsu]